MDDEELADARQAVQPRVPLFSVVHDPLTGRFFLQEREECGTTRGGKLAAKHVGTASAAAPSFPWEQIVLPPRSVSKLHCAVSPSASAGVDTVEATHEAVNQPDSIASLPSPTRRTRLGVNRSARTSKVPDDMAAMLLTLPEHSDNARAIETTIKWNGEPLSVRVVGLATTDSSCGDERSEESLDPRIVQTTGRSTDNGQWLSHTYDLKQLARIRPTADGFRDRNVNIGCSFTPMDLWSESEPEEVEKEEEQEVSSSDESELPVFQRGDRVLFRVAGSLIELTGRVVDRVHRSVFYDVRGSDGCMFKSVFAGNMSLCPARERKPRTKPRYHFAKHDKVLWLLPKGDEDGNNDSEENEQGTYKARVLKVRSLDRFDLLLRTGRVIKRVPHEQLRPRDAF
jgi:hypothetical protein